MANKLPEQQKKWQVGLKEFLFTYLTMSKLWYFFNMIATMESLSATVVIPALFNRLITWDLPIIFTIGAFYAIDIFKIRNRYKYLIHYFVLMGAYQVVVLNSIGRFDISLNFFIYFTVTYAIVVTVLLLKDHFKAKVDKI